MSTLPEMPRYVEEFTESSYLPEVEDDEPPKPVVRTLWYCNGFPEHPGWYMRNRVPKYATAEDLLTDASPAWIATFQQKARDYFFRQWTAHGKPL